MQYVCNCGLVYPLTKSREVTAPFTSFLLVPLLCYCVYKYCVHVCSVWLSLGLGPSSNFFCYIMCIQLKERGVRRYMYFQCVNLSLPPLLLVPHACLTHTNHCYLSFYPQYYAECQGVIYVVDSSDSENLAISSQTFSMLIIS